MKKTDLFREGVNPEQRPGAQIRQSQIIGVFGPGALVDFVDDAVVLAGLSYWAKGERVTEDRLTAALARTFASGDDRPLLTPDLFAPPLSDDSLDPKDRTWIKAFRFPEWFVCQNEHCWEQGGLQPRSDGAKPRRLLRINQLDGAGHKCQGGKGKTSRVQPVRFTRACRMGHIDDIAWIALAHIRRQQEEPCRRPILWIDEAAASGDLNDVRLTCGGCGASIRMSLARRERFEDRPPLGYCEGKRLWLADDAGVGCGEPMRFLLRSASHAYFSTTASVLHIPDPDAAVRDKVAGVYELIKNVKSAAQIDMLREMQEPVAAGLEGVPAAAAFAEVVRRRAAT